MLRIEKTDKVALVTLDRPEAMNALSRELRSRLHAAFVELDADPSQRRGAYRRGTSLYRRARPEGAGTSIRSAWARRTRPEPRRIPVLAIRQCRKPVIGAINGVAITGGFEVALACDVLIASTAARFADTHARVGIMPGWGLSQRLPRTIGVYRAKELSLSGNFLDAKTALEWGLVNRVVEPDELVPTAMKLAADMASIPAETLMTYKSIIDRRGFDLDLADGRRWNASDRPRTTAR